MPRDNKSQYAILGKLSKQDLSGYDLINFFKKVSHCYWSESNAQVYGMLKRFEEQGLVTATDDKNSGARKRRVYSITDKGMQHLKEWLAQPTNSCMYRDELMLKLSCGQHMSQELIIKQLQDFRRQILEQLEDQQRIVDHIADDHDGRDDQAYLMMVYDYVGMGLKTKLQWVDKQLSDLAW